MKKPFKNILVITLAVAVVIVVASLFFQKKLPFSDSLTNVFPKIPSARLYKQVITKPEGWFKTGQAADLILYADDFNNAGSATNLNYPMKVVSDGKRLIVSDTYNNRVLIWNRIPTQDHTPADLVIG